VPEDLRQMIETQIERLTTEEQRALEAASVTGAVFSSRITAVAADLDQEQFEDLCERLSRRDLMLRAVDPQHFPDATVSDRYEFVHASYLEVFYGRQATASRAKLRERIGESLDALSSERLGEIAAELANHFEESCDWSRVIRYIRLVAESAGWRYAHREAIAMLELALRLVSQLQHARRRDL
jgi:predicted ATPase